MAITRHASLLVLLVLPFASLFTSCSTVKPIEVGGDSSLPSELSIEFKQKFEIRDIADPAPGTESNGSAVPIGDVKRKGVKKVVDKAKKKEPAKFAYIVRRPEKDPVWLGEKLTYEVMYFGVAAGEFTTEVLPFKMINNRKVYHVRARALSSKLFSLFYRLDDTIETFIDYDGFFSHRFHMILNESKQSRDSLELFDSEKGETFFWNRIKSKDKGFSEVKVFAPVPSFSQDTLSTLYYLRTIPLPDGAVVNIPIVSETKAWEAVITVVRREQIDSPMGKINAVVLKFETKYQGVLKKQGDSFIWLSDDERRLLLRLEAKVKVGTVTGVLKKVEQGTPPH